MDGIPWIRFKDKTFFKLCLPLWDVDGDGGITSVESEKAVVINDYTFGENLDIVDATDFINLNWQPSGICGVFRDCTNLRYAAIKDGTYLRGNMFLNCTSLEKVVLPMTILDFNSSHGSTFKNCKALKHIILPLNKTIYSSYYFYEAGLEELEFPDAVNEIGMYACFKCLALKTVIIGKGITIIANTAFNTCPSMTSCYIKAITPPAISAWTFDNNSCNFYVPRSSVDSYKNATNWKQYASRIYEYDFNNE